MRVQPSLVHFFDGARDVSARLHDGVEVVVVVFARLLLDAPQRKLQVPAVLPQRVHGGHEPFGEERLSSRDGGGVGPRERRRLRERGVHRDARVAIHAPHRAFLHVHAQTQRHAVLPQRFRVRDERR